MILLSRYSRVSLFAVALITIAVIAGCVKKSNQDVAPPYSAATCFDLILNQGEYKVDCGGPCVACQVGKPSLTVTVDSTWMPESSKKAARYWKPANVLLQYSGDMITVTAVDTFNSGPPNHIRLTFAIDKNFGVGVHEIPVMQSFEQYYSQPPGFPSGSVSLKNGVISITNRDEVNKLISGEFRFNSYPQTGTGNILVLENGKFNDISLVKP